MPTEQLTEERKAYEQIRQIKAYWLKLGYAFGDKDIWVEPLYLTGTGKAMVWCIRSTMINGLPTNPMPNHTTVAVRQHQHSTHNSISYKTNA